MATVLERLLRRDRLVIAGVLAGLTSLAWLQMVLPGDAPPGAHALMPCCGARFGVALSMWIVMMAGMMIPSVAPMLLTHAAIMRRRRVAHTGTSAASAPFLPWPSGLFLAGYVLAWAVFSAAASLAQCALYRSALLDGHSLSVAPWAGGAVLLTAGLFQLSPAKNACLARCRTPVGYFITEWREGHLGAVQMGLRHGLFCIGCCWSLMAILFAVGIMNILWGAAITAFVIAEKVLPWRRAVVWAGGASCLVGAAALFYRAALAA